MAGTITWCEFAAGARFIYQTSKSIGDQWQIRGDLEEYAAAHLVKKTHTPLQDLSLVTENNSTFLEQDIQEDIGTLVEETITQLVMQEYHVLYSPAYSVPVLYFQYFHQNGSRFTVDQVWQLFQKNAVTTGSSLNKLETLTEQEHPLLGEPWFMLHPCNTANLMKSAPSHLHSGERYLVAWLSCLAPLVGCPVSHQYAVELNRQSI